jgi:hypothetical protein
LVRRMHSLDYYYIELMMNTTNERNNYQLKQT